MDYPTTKECPYFSVLLLFADGDCRRVLDIGIHSYGSVCANVRSHGILSDGTSAVDRFMVGANGYFFVIFAVQAFSG